MKFEAGKCYRMRNGRKAQVDHVDCDGIYPMSGVITNIDGGKNPCAWYPNGRTKDEHYEIPLDIFDLVALWDEPVKIWVYLRIEFHANGIFSGTGVWSTVDDRSLSLAPPIEIELTDGQAKQLGITIPSV